MHPVPCAHCALNFMRKTVGGELSKLCDNCLRAEERRTKKENVKEVEKVMRVAFSCPQELYVFMEEICTVQGISLDEHIVNCIKILKNSYEESKESILQEDSDDFKKEPKKGRPKK